MLHRLCLQRWTRFAVVLILQKVVRWPCSEWTREPDDPNLHWSPDEPPCQQRTARLASSVGSCSAGLGPSVESELERPGLTVTLEGRWDRGAARAGQGGHVQTGAMGAELSTKGS